MEDILLCILHGERYDGPTHSRINALLKVKANGGDYDEPRLSRIEELIYEWISGGDISTYTGTLPATLQTVAGYLLGYKVWGNTGGVGAETENLFDAATAYGNMYDSATGTLVGAASSLTAMRNKFDSSMVGVPITISIHADDVPVTRVYIRCTIGGTNVDSNSIANGKTGIMTVTVTPTSVNDDWRITFGTGAGDITLSDIMLNSGSTALPYEPYGYKLPILSNDTTTADIYIGDTQLAKDEYVDSETGKIYRYVDGTLTPTDPPTPFPQIPTFAGETIVDYGIAALPHAAGLDGIFEYGNIGGLTWKNSVSGENDITFDTAVTDTGAEYVLPAGASGQYTSKSGEYRTAFTWYCIAKCPTTCHSAGQYMISDLGNGIGVEISSGWAAYSSAGGNHLVRGVDNRDYNSQMPVTGYALMAVAGDVNGTASIYVNGEKMTDSWNFNPVSSDGANTVFLGKRANGQLSGTDIDYKFLAFGTAKQTDAEIAANSQYLMTKYLGVGRPEKVELKYR
jgi:hypothetical protein